jgi:predicted DsbA family dithiol-disulfide isomerase
MFKKNYIAEDALKDAVLNKVANRVGMDGPAFDQWLAIPAVQ